MNYTDKRKIQILLNTKDKIQRRLEQITKTVYFKEKGEYPTQGYMRALRELGFVA